MSTANSAQSLTRLHKQWWIAARSSGLVVVVYFWLGQAGLAPDRALQWVRLLKKEIDRV